MVAALDTLEVAKRLRGAGFSETQAETITGVLRDNRDADISQLASKADVSQLATKVDVTAVRSELEIMRRDLEILRRDLTIRLGSMLVVATGILLAAKFFG